MGIGSLIMGVVAAAFGVALVAMVGQGQEGQQPAMFGSSDFCLSDASALSSSCCTRTCKMFRQDVDELLASGQQVDGLYPRNNAYPRLHPLFVAAEDLDHGTFEKIVGSGLVDVNVRDSGGANAIISRTMIATSHMTKFAKLLPYSHYLSGDVNISRVINLFPWMPSVLRAWQSYGDDPISEEYSRPTYTRILDAMAQPELRLMEIFKKHGGDLEAVDGHGRTTLHHAARNGAAELVAGLLDLGCDPRAMDKQGQAPIHFAARRNFGRVVSLLQAASGDIRNNFGRTTGDILTLREESAERARAEASSRLAERLREQQDRGASGGWSNGLTGSSVAKLHAHSSQCERRSAAELQGNKFWDDFHAIGAPVVITDGLAGWDKSLFSKTKISRELGHTEQVLGSIPYPRTVGGVQSKVRFSQFLSGMASGSPIMSPGVNVTGRQHANKPMYYFKEMPCDREPGCKKAFLNSELYSLHGEFEVPTCISGSPNYEQTTWQVILGPSNSGASEHFHYDSANMLIHGAKQWFLTPPDEAGFSNVHPADDMMQQRNHVISCVQLENEIIFVPRGWGHAVINHGDTVAMAAEFKDKSDASTEASHWDSREDMRKRARISGQPRPA